jgi:hypothetical protein
MHVQLSLFLRQIRGTWTRSCAILLLTSFPAVLFCTVSTNPFDSCIDRSLQSVRQPCLQGEEKAPSWQRGLWGRTGAQQLICIGLEVFLTTSLNNQWVPSLLIPPPPRLAKAPFVLHPRRFPPPRHGPRILPDRDRMPWAIKGSTLHIRQLLVPFLPNLPPPRSSAPSRPAAAEIFWIVHSVQAGRVCSSLFTAMACGAGYLVLFN